MWLASVSLRDSRGAPIPTEDWADHPNGRLRRGEAVLDDALGDLGDRSRERQFRMPITLCRHRALTPAEHEALPKWWHDAQAIDIAGPPLEVMWSRGIKESPALQPCAAPGRQPLAADPRIYLIIPCLACDSCAARASA